MTAFVVTTEIFVRMRVVPNSPVEHQRRLMGDPAIMGAAIGDSRLRDGFVPSSGVANLSFAGNDFDTVMGLAHTFVGKRDHPFVIIQAAPHFFAQYRIIQDQRALLAELRGDSVSPLAIMRPHIRQYLLSYWESGLKNPQLLFGEADKKPKDIQPSKSWADIPNVERSRRASIRAQLQVPIGGFEKSPLATQFENQIAELSKVASVCLVGMPVSMDYRHVALTYARVAQARAYYAEIAARYQIPYLDLWIAPYPDALFSSSDHLNSDGAMRLTSEVSEFCRIPTSPPAP